ncbi:MAG: MurR/RpiR family transcriptional regulator [Oscillospiraceae bacterium]
MDMHIHIESDNELNGGAGEYLSRISTQYSFLPKQQKKLAKYILDHKEEVSRCSITTLSRKTGIAPSTITRFCQSLSYSGFSELKFYMSRKELLGSAGSLIENSDPIETIVEKLLKSGSECFAETLRTVNLDSLQDIVGAIISANTVHIYGQSSSYYSALYGQQLLMLSGILSQAYNDTVNMSGAAGLLRKGDAVIGLAYSGEARGVNEALYTAKEQGAKVIAITATPDSTLARLADHILYYSHDIPDDLHYMFLPNLCEITIWGVIQSSIMLNPGQRDKLGFPRQSILQNRMK